MAYIKIFPITVTPKKAIDYITNPDKTDENQHKTKRKKFQTKQNQKTKRKITKNHS